MFHVELNYQSSINKRIVGFILVLFVSLACNPSRQIIQIPDYIILPNGKEVLGNYSLNAFIFENNLKNLTIEKFLSIKFKGENYYSKEYRITIDNTNFKLLLYDNDEFEKYFNSSNFAVINLEPENSQYGQQRKFVAFSVVNDRNEDCLAETSLVRNIVVNYLNKLKDEYYNL